MKISTSTIIFLSIILITGVITMITDLKIKKIYNDHLTIGLVLGLAALIYSAVWTQENVLFHLGNFLIAFVVGTLFYRFDLWKGGDAKLFTLYAFLMPPLGHNFSMFSGAIDLFACSFIIGSIILLPIFIKDIISNNLLSPIRLGALSRAIISTIFLSWILFPVYHFTIYHFAKIVNTSIISLTVTYLIFKLSRSFLKDMKVSYLIIGAGITFGFLARFWLSPNSLSWPVLPYSILKIGIFSALSACICGTLDNLKENHDRVPFAPLLFTGCVLSYTPFLTLIMRYLHL